MASESLVVIGILLVVLGLFVAGNLAFVALGMAGILGGGLLQVAMARRK